MVKLTYVNSTWNEAIKSLRRNLLRTVLTILGLVVGRLAQPSLPSCFQSAGQNAKQKKRRAPKAFIEFSARQPGILKPNKRNYR